MVMYVATGYCQEEVDPIEQPNMYTHVLENEAQEQRHSGSHQGMKL